MSWNKVPKHLYNLLTKIIIMNDTVKKDIISTLARTIEVLLVKEEKDIVEMKDLSNSTIHNASIFQDEDSVSIAILIYSLSKMIERKQGELDYKALLKLFNSAHSYIVKEDFSGYRKEVHKIFDFISSIDSKLKLYIEEVINQAQIKKGSKLYDHGISMERAASVLGISEWELMRYIGKTNMPDIALEGPVDVKTRLNFTRSLFVGK